VTAGTASRTVGRPRSAFADRAILEATVRLLGERGYQALTMEAVAAEAGVGKPTLYRRYSSKAELVAAALLGIAGEDDMGPLPGSAKEALRVLLRGTAAALANPGGMTILGTLIAQERRDPELIETFRERVFRPRHDVVRAVLERGVQRGQIRREADLEVVIDLLFGGLLARAALGEVGGVEWVDRVLEQVWVSIAERGAGG
jgi:AcrR family transcriptional regulator